jgi:ABC-type lipoprotein export system ATPase subunit
MVTHDPRYAEHAQRTIHLFDGRIVDEKSHMASGSGNGLLAFEHSRP